LQLLAPQNCDGDTAAVAQTQSSAETFATSAYKCDKIPFGELQKIKALQSQEKEDKRLLSWFNGLCGGSYIEMGAHDGVYLSNSHVFNKGGFQWKGVLIEPCSNYDKLIVNRPDEIATIRAAACKKPGKVHWVDCGAVGGIWEFANEGYRKKWWSDLTVEDLPELECLPLGSLLEKHAAGVTFFDFWSLDIEGVELLALQSIDLNKVGFGIVVVECEGKDSVKDKSVRDLLERHGYVCLRNTRRNVHFKNGNFDKIYENLVD